MAPRYMSAAAGQLVVKGVKVANCTSITWRENVSRRAVRVIGKTEADERLAVAYDCSITIAFVRLRQLDEIEIGLLGGRDTLSLIQEETVQMQVGDKIGGKAKYKFVDMAYTSGDWSMPAGDALTGSCSYEGSRLKLGSEK